MTLTIFLYYYLFFFGHYGQYLELRFGKKARVATSLAYTLQMTLYIGVVIYAPALALEALTGISRLTAILSTGLVNFNMN